MTFIYTVLSQWKAIRFLNHTEDDLLIRQVSGRAAPV